MVRNNLNCIILRWYFHETLNSLKAKMQTQGNQIILCVIFKKIYFILWACFKHHSNKSHADKAMHLKKWFDNFTRILGALYNYANLSNVSFVLDIGNTGPSVEKSVFKNLGVKLQYSIFRCQSPRPPLSYVPHSCCALLTCQVQSHQWYWSAAIKNSEIRKCH